jgi:hypothetical protein
MLERKCLFLHIVNVPAVDCNQRLDDKYDSRQLAVTGGVTSKLNMQSR